MKNLFYFISILFIIAGLNDSVTAQPQYYNYTGAGNGSNSFPFNVAAGKDVQLLYLAGEFNQPSSAPAGNIISVSLFFNAGFGPATYTDLTIKMGQSGITNLTPGAFYSGSLTTVYYRASVSLTTAGSSWLTFTLDSPFAYDPTQSLIVDVGQCGGSGTLGGTNAYTNLSGVRRVWSVAGCPFVAYASSSIYVYNMGFTLGASGGPPVVVTTAATTVTGNSANLNGTVNANNASTTVTFEYGLTAAYGTTVPGVPPTVTGSSVTPVTAAITGLTNNTTYHYRVNGVNSYGTTNGGDLTFTTLGPPPAVVTTAATGITGTTATLNGTVNANNVSTTVSFDYGLTAGYGTTIAGVPSPITGNTVTPASAAIAGLAANTTYHYRIKGASANGTSNGNDLTFTTTGPPPTVVTTAATSITGTTATLNGTVNPNNSFSTVYFEYGLTTAYGTMVSAVPPTLTGNIVTAVSAAITGLLPGICYHYRVISTNSNGPSVGNDMSFCAPTLAPSLTTNAATAINTTVATLNGVVNANGSSTTVWFDYGLTVAYGTTVAATPATVTGNTSTPVSASLIGLTNSTTYHYRVRGINAVGTTNGNDVTFITGCFAAGPAGPVTGQTQVCQGGSGYVYSVTPITNASGYIWTVPVGGTITAGANTNTITVSYSPTAVSGYVYVYAIAACGNGAPAQLGVAMNAPPAPTVAGPASVCVGSTGNVYTTQSGMSNYTWIISSGGLVTAGGTTSSNTVTVTWTTTGAKTVTVNYSNAAGCLSLTPTVYNVTVNALPVPTVTGPNPACTNIPYVYSTQTGMTGYSWTISAGGVITSGAGTNAINIVWLIPGVQNVSVNYLNANGCSAPAPVAYPVIVNASPVPTITGNTNVCINSGYYNYTTEAGMTGYTWSVSPGGTINFGGGTNVLQVLWPNAGAQWVRVNYNNLAGCPAPNPTQLNVTVSGYPGATGAITGTATVCAGASGVAYSVSPVTNAVAYVWTLPAGATIASGSGTNSITVNFGATASSGNITVYANNVCGNGTASPNFAVTVNAIPATPVVTNTGYTAESSAPSGNQWYYSVTQSGTGAPIAGATAQTYDATLTGAGYYWSIVTLNGCASDTSNHKLILVTGFDSHSSSAINIYPIPNDGRFNVSITSASNESFSIRVYNSLGVKIYEETKVEVSGSLQKVIDLRPVPNGVYSVIFENSLGQVVKKIVVNK